MSYDDGMPLLWHDEETFTIDEDDVPVGPVRQVDEMPPERPTASNPGARPAPVEDPLVAAVRAADFAAAGGQIEDDEEPTVRADGLTREQADAQLLTIGWLKIVPNTSHDPADMYTLTDPSLPTIDEAVGWIERARAAIDEHERNGGTAALRRKITERVDRIDLQCERWLMMVTELRSSEPRYYPPHVAEARALALRSADDAEPMAPARRERRTVEPTPISVYRSVASE